MMGIWVGTGEKNGRVFQKFIRKKGLVNGLGLIQNDLSLKQFGLKAVSLTSLYFKY